MHTFRCTYDAPAITLGIVMYEKTCISQFKKIYVHSNVNLSAIGQFYVNIRFCGLIPGYFASNVSSAFD